jgi:hypothetical protein
MPVVRFTKVDDRVWHAGIKYAAGMDTVLRQDFDSMTAISISRSLKDNYGIDASIKKSGYAKRNPTFNVLVKFDNDEDQDLFIMKASEGFNV